MNCSIVILNWNGAHMLRKYLPAVIKNSEGAEIVVADNASTDDSLQLLASDFPTVRTIVLDKNYGFADGYNRAFTALEAENEAKGEATPEYYLLLNSDVDVPEGWLTPLISFMDNNPDVAACQPKLHAIHDRESFEYAGAAGGMIDRYGYPFCRGRIFGTVEKDNGQYDKNAEIFWATGACMLIRSQDYHEAGGLDGRFFAHNEEIDLCWRLRLMGRKIYCITDSVVYHLGGGTLPQGNPRKTFLNFRNNLTMLYKNLPDDELRHVMRIRFFLDWLAALQMLILDRSYGSFKAVKKARKEFNEWKHDFDADRLRIKELTAVKEIPERIRMSILWQYYARRKKTWTYYEKS